MRKTVKLQNDSWVYLLGFIAKDLLTLTIITRKDIRIKEEKRFKSFCPYAYEIFTEHDISRITEFFDKRS